MAKSVELSDGRTMLLRSMRAVELPALTEMGVLLKGLGDGITPEANGKIMGFLASIATQGGLPVAVGEIEQLELGDYMALISALADVVNVNPTTAPLTHKRGSR